jgi:stage II sporulation protein D
LKAVKPLTALFVTLAFVVIMLPALLVLPFSADKADGELSEKLEGESLEQVANTVQPSTVDVAVYRTAEQSIQSIPIETYIIGVVAAEMPADFEMEALKAQALTARTYIVNQLLSDNKLGVPDGADVTDTVVHQVYKNDQELKTAWGSDYSWKMNKINEAVTATTGQILTYDGKPITATFFSTSNGYTENSEDYWSNSYPYLKSVSSPWDTESPKFYDQTTLSLKDFQKKLGVTLPSGNEIGTVTARTTGNRVATVEIGGKKLTGKQIRDSLDLNSSDFTWERKGEHIVITTKGYGHGVGMSQYGANGMAQEGKDYGEIVKHYYQGVNIESANALLHTITAKK